MTIQPKAAFPFSMANIVAYKYLWMHVGHDFRLSLQVKNILKQGGGVREFYLNELVTHIIAESPPDPATLPLSDVTVVKVRGLSCYIGMLNRV